MTTAPATANIPVTILSGFLGAGKTTLLNHILSNQQGVKTAVLVNEFGEIGIDNDLIVTTDEDMVELSNGCICCSINDELMEAVERVIERPEPLDYIVVETTGLADPLPVAMTFLGSELRDQTRLDSIITLIDAENFDDVVLDTEVGRAQVIYGDILLLNKCDLVSEERLEAVEQQLRDVKNDARILRSVKGDVPLPLLLSVGLFESDKVSSPADDPSLDHSDCDHDHGHCNHDHDTVTITVMNTITTMGTITVMTTAMGTVMTMATITTATTTATIRTSRDLHPCPSKVMAPSPCASSRTSSTTKCPRKCFEPKEFCGSTKANAAMCSTWRANAFPSTTPTGPVIARINWC